MSKPWWFNYRHERFRKKNYLTTEMIIRKSVVETVKEYLDNCSLGGIKQIRDPTNSKLQRFIWLAIFCVYFSTVILFLRSTWTSTLTRPLIVTKESSTYPIKNIEFPAVALCNFDRISRTALENMLFQYIDQIDTTNQTAIINMVTYFVNLGRLIDYRYVESLHGIVDKLPSKESKADVRRIMEQIAPSCEEMLLKCQWAGKIVNCSDIFHTRRTGMGHCCVFNYVLEMNSVDRVLTQPKSQTLPGASNGLMVIADPKIDDGYYKLGFNDGFQVMIYDPRQFPDLSAGRILFRMAQPDQAVFLRLSSIKQYATPEVRKYPYKTRKCLFRNEMQKMFGNMYSYSACLVNCRIATVKSLCKCVPYFYPVGLSKDSKVCTLRHLKCLNKYKEKLLYFYPMDTQNTSGLEAELADSLYCPSCYPDCELTQHYTKNFRVSLSKITSTIFGDDFLKDMDLSGKCGLAIYHSSAVGTLHRLDVVSYWFEILSNIGGFAGMIMGIGCFTFVEVLYFSTIRFFRTLLNNFKKYQ